MSKNFNGWSISKELFDWIIKNVPIGKTILELGSGLGTKELVKHYKVYSVEHDKKWLGVVSGTNYIYAPLVDGWYDVSILKDKLPKHYDVLLIDGPPQEKRGNILKHLPLFNLDVIIIVDDTHRKLDLEIANVLKENKNVIEIISKDKKAIIIT